jgi:hypothetical protein
MSTEAEARSELAIWLAVDAAVAAAFWAGQGPVAGALAGVGALAVTVLVFLGRRWLGSAQVAAGFGDERVRGLYTRANSITATVLWAIVTPWWLVTVARGSHDEVLLVLVVVQTVTFLGACAYLARRS